MRKLVSLIVAMLVIAAPAYATLLVGDDFNSYSGTIDGQGNWIFTDANGSAGPVADNGAAKWDMPGNPTGEMTLKQSFDTVNSGILNAYFDITLDSSISGVDKGTTMSMIKLYSSDSKEYLRLRMYSGTDWTVGDPYNDINVLNSNAGGSTVYNPAMGAVTSIWMSIDVATHTATISVKENGSWVTKLSNIGLYQGFGAADIARIDWVMYRYNDFIGYDYASATLDNLYIYHNETMPEVPEPGSIVALCSGLVGMVGFARRRRA